MIPSSPVKMKPVIRLKIISPVEEPLNGRSPNKVVVVCKESSSEKYRALTASYSSFPSDISESIAMEYGSAVSFSK